MSALHLRSPLRGRLLRPRLRPGSQAVMHDITALLAMVRRRPEPIPR